MVLTTFDSVGITTGKQLTETTLFFVGKLQIVFTAIKVIGIKLAQYFARKKQYKSSSFNINYCRAFELWNIFKVYTLGFYYVITSANHVGIYVTIYVGIS